MSIRITPEGVIKLRATLKALHLTPRSILVVENEDPREIIDALSEAANFPWNIPVIVLRPGEKLYTVDKAVLEDALRTVAENEQKQIGIF